MDTLEQTYADLLAEKLDGIASRLDRLAAEIRRAKQSLPKSASYAETVGGVQADILWAVANLNLGSLTSQAARADDAKAKGE